MKKLLLILFIFVFASSAWATVYKWVDERGVVHFSDDWSKVPPDYRNKVEEVNITKTGPSLPSQVPSGKTAGSAQSGEAATQAPSIAQTLIREGDFAIKLADALKLGQAQNEAEAESLLASAGIAPKNGWIADYPVTPDIIGELQNTITEAVDSGKLGMKKDEAMKVFQGVITQQGLPVRADMESQYSGVQPPQNYPEYYEPSAIDNYYYDQGPPIVTYYPPPWDYNYMYAWVPYPFWYTGFWFPGFFVLRDFHRHVNIHGHGRFISNHFWDPRARGFGRVDPARRHMGNATANISHPARGFSSHAASSGASSILRRSYEHTGVHRSTGVISGNRGGSGSSNFRGGVSGVRPPTGYRPPSTGYSRSGGVSLGRPAHGSSFSHWGGFSHSGIGTGRSFSPPSSRSGNSGFHSGGFGSEGSPGVSRGFSRGGGGGHR
jgi:hypothetical protein